MESTAPTQDEAYTVKRDVDGADNVGMTGGVGGGRFTCMPL